jgi:hypothetical protein
MSLKSKVRLCQSGSVGHSHAQCEAALNMQYKKIAAYQKNSLFIYPQSDFHFISVFKVVRNIFSHAAFNPHIELDGLNLNLEKKPSSYLLTISPPKK